MNGHPTTRLPRDPNDDQQDDDRLDQLILLIGQMLKELQGLTAQVGSIDSRLGGLETRVGSLETKVDQRLKETQPLWALIEERFNGINKRLDAADANLSSFRFITEQRLDTIEKVVNTTRNDMLELRTDFRGLRKNLRQQFPDMEFG